MPALVGLDVSRETLDRLSLYEALLRKWNPKINLVSRTTLDAVWTRHFHDSAQLYGLIPAHARHLADLGSGAGFPGMVLAILARELGSPDKTTLVESDMRKAQFLRTVARELEIEAEVVNKRIEDAEPLRAHVLTARALAPLITLFDFAERHLDPEGLAVFPKGKNWQKEVEDAQTKWQFEVQIDKSETNASSVILSVKGLARV
ncbi:MAG: 16S rRNA (guanine(527)-N(7))-methyltransferase RsmG [Pseudomonadota bacterium]